MRVAASIGRIVLCCTFFFASGTWAQVSSAAGAIEGWVLDEFMSAVAGAQVKVRKPLTGLTRVVETDARGYYHIADLPVGEYSLEVSQSGFAVFRQQGVVVSLGSTVRVDDRLELASQAQHITVNEAPPLIDPAQTSMTSSVGRERIEESPVRTRNALDFVLMEPNVAPIRSSAGSAQ